jgi:hypothetical protein
MRCRTIVWFKAETPGMFSDEQSIQPSNYRPGDRRGGAIIFVVEKKRESARKNGKIESDDGF